MDDPAKQLERILEEEESLQFSEFTSDTALRIGLALIGKARERKLVITIDITRNGHQLFHFAMPGTSPDNDQWVIRKNRVVYRFHRSSLAVATRLRILGMSMEQKYGLSSSEYAPSGGAFPLVVRNVGTVGTVTVSGLTQEEDHALVVETLREQLGID